MQTKITPFFYIKRMMSSETTSDLFKNYVAAVDCANRISFFSLIERSTKITDFFVEMASIPSKVFMVKSD